MAILHFEKTSHLKRNYGTVNDGFVDLQDEGSNTNASDYNYDGYNIEITDKVNEVTKGQWVYGHMNEGKWIRVYVCLFFPHVNKIQF